MNEQLLQKIPRLRIYHYLYRLNALYVENHYLILVALNDSKSYVDKLDLKILHIFLVDKVFLVDKSQNCVGHGILRVEGLVSKID